jgi:hypothetical protein
MPFDVIAIVNRIKINLYIMEQLEAYALEMRPLLMKVQNPTLDMAAIPRTVKKKEKRKKRQPG